MPIPTAYTEKTLAEFMHTSLGKLAQVLDLHFAPEGPGDYAESVNDALLAFGVNDIAGISGIPNLQKLRALARVAVLQYVVTNFAALYDFSADGASYNRSQMFEYAKEMLTLAEQAALPYGGTYQVQVVAVNHKHDPYQVRPEDETGL